MNLLFFFMIASLVLTLLVSVVAIIISTSTGTDWFLRLWKRLTKEE